MRRIDYAQVAGLIARQGGRIVELNASTFAVLLDALAEYEFRGVWHNDNEDLTDNEWDIAQKWVNDAIYELLTIYDCDEEPPNGEGTVSKYAILRDEKATTVDGGSCGADVWQQRDVNVEMADPHNLVTLSSNKFTPIDDNFRILVRAAAFDCYLHRLRLYNVTQSSIVDVDINNHADPANNVGNHAFLSQLFSPDGSDEYRIDHYTFNAKTNTGLGSACDDGGVEVYLTILLELVD